MLAYLDSSALAKLVLSEPETSSLWDALTGWPERVSSKLSRLEVMLAAGKHGEHRVRDAEAILGDITLLPIDDVVLDLAERFTSPPLRSLDAIHVATALSIGQELTALVTYDARMAEAARANGLRVESPR